VGVRFLSRVEAATKGDRLRVQVPVNSLRGGCRKAEKKSLSQVRLGTDEDSQIGTFRTRSSIRRKNQSRLSTNGRGRSNWTIYERRLKNPKCGEAHVKKEKNGKPAGGVKPSRPLQ